jgi:5-hydroxyisourate hydrolase-like protein (transthyretin family)
MAPMRNKRDRSVSPTQRVIRLCATVCLLLLFGQVPRAGISAAARDRSVPPTDGNVSSNGGIVPQEVVRRAAQYYGNARWPGSRILAMTPYYAIDGTVNAWAVQFAKSGCPWTSEEEAREAVVAGERRLRAVQASRPEPPSREAVRDAMMRSPGRQNVPPKPVFENVGATSATVRVTFPPNEGADPLQELRAAHGQSLRAWREDLRRAIAAGGGASEAGTLIMGGRRDCFPLLERFDGVAPHLESESEVRRLGQVPIDQARPIRRTYYAGPMAVFHEVATAQPLDGRLRVYDSSNRQMLDWSGRPASELPGPLRMGAPEPGSISPQELWDLFERGKTPPESGRSAGEATPTSLIDGVPSVWQGLYGPGTCGPVASMQAFGYWDSNGYGNLIDNGDPSVGHEDELVYDLMRWEDYAFNQASPSTKGDMIEPGMEVTAAVNGLAFDVMSLKQVDGWALMKQQIDAKRPFVFFNFNSDIYPNWKHFTTGVGYSEAGGRWLYVNRNNGGGPWELNMNAIPAENQWLYPVWPTGAMFDTIHTDDFEDPTLPAWSYRISGEYPPYWDTTTYRARNSTPNPWPIGGNPAFSVYCHPWMTDPPGPYDKNMSAMMVYGPFATTRDRGQVTASIWRHIPDPQGDAIALMVSLDGQDFWGTAYYGDVRSWQACSLDLSNVPGLGYVLHKPQVWVGIWFVSDGDSLTGEGAYVDDLGITMTPVSPIVIDSPKKGDIFENGQIQQILWRSMGDMGLGRVKIELFRGQVLAQTIANSTPNDGNEFWLLDPLHPLPPAPDYRIKITNVDNVTRWANSGVFEIMEKASFYGIYPSGGQEYTRGGSMTVLWFWTGYPGSTVNVRLMKNDTTHRLMALGTPNDGRLVWTIPASETEGSDYKVRVESAVDPAVFGESGANFTIEAPNITVLQPHISDWWARGQTHTIAWEWEGNPGPNVRIRLSRQAGPNLVYQTITTQTANTGSFQWAIPDAQVPALFSYRIAINSTSDPSYSDSSDLFTITTGTAIHLLSPNGGEWWTRGTTQTIEWDSAAGGSIRRLVQIDLFRNDPYDYDPFQQSFVQTITASTRDGGSYDWVIPTTLPTGGGYKVRVNFTYDDMLEDWSDASFYIRAPRVLAHSPSLGMTLFKEMTHTIQWETLDLPRGMVRLELLPRDTVVTPTLNVRVPDTGAYEWTIPSWTTPRSDYRIRITPEMDPSASAMTFGTFAIAEQGIRVTWPKRGDVWRGGTSQTIAWDAFGLLPDSEVVVELLEGTVWRSQITSTSITDQSLEWRVPKTLPTGERYRIRVRSLWDPTFVGVSDGYFAIVQTTAVEPSRWRRQE